MFVCTMEQCRSLVYWKALYFDSMPFTCLETVMASSFRQRQNTWFWPSKFEYSIFVLSYHNSHLYKNWNIISKFFLWILSCFKLLSSMNHASNQSIHFFLIFSTTELCFIIMILTLSHQEKKLDYFSILILSATTQFFYSLSVWFFKKDLFTMNFKGGGWGSSNCF